MERVAFLVDRTGERIDCMLNPETFEVRRLAGVRPHATASGQLVGTGLSDDPLLFTGGGPQGSTMTILLLIYNYAFVNGDYGAATALSVLLALALAVLSAVFQFATRGWSTE